MRSMLMGCVCGAVVLNTAHSSAQVARDACSAAQTVGIGSYSGTTIGATNDGSASCGESQASPDVWYRYLATTDRRLVVTLCGGTTVYDTVLSIHSGCPGTPVNQLDCNDDFCGNNGLQSQVAVNLEIGQTYFIRIAGYSGSTGQFTMTTSEVDRPPPAVLGPDVIVGDINGVQNFGSANNITAFSVGTTSCNVGDAPIEWVDNTPAHPVIAQNLYRIWNGRFEQIGQSWLKHGFASVNDDLCYTCIQPPGGSSQLGVGCSDPYGTGLNGDQSNLGPRSQVNATTGVFPYPFNVGPTSSIVIRRLQVPNAFIDPAQNAGAIYLAEAQYVTADDAQWRVNDMPATNGLNNVSYRRVQMRTDAGFLPFLSDTQRTVPAVYGWHAYDSSVVTGEADYQEGPIVARFHCAAKVTDNADGTWTYVYAIRNHNSHRSGYSFSVPLGSLSASAVGFHDVDSHSGEPYSNSDWTNTIQNASLVWRSTQTFAQNPNANALRWGTTYTFWFTTTAGPVNGEVSIALFRPGAAGEPTSVSARLPVPDAGRCVADLDDGTFTGTPDGGVTIDDLLYFLVLFEAGDGRADLDDGTFTGTRDGGVTIDDLLYMLIRFEAGC